MLLLKSLWRGFRDSNRIRLAVFDSLRLRDIRRDSPYYYCGLSFWRPLWIAYTTVMQSMPSVFMQWLCDDYSIDNETKADENYVDPREGDSVCLLLHWSGRYWRLFHWKGQVEVGQGKKVYTHSTQMAKCWQTLPGLLAKQIKLLSPSKHGTISL